MKKLFVTFCTVAVFAIAANAQDVKTEKKECEKAKTECCAAKCTKPADAKCTKDASKCTKSAEAKKSCCTKK